MAEDAQMIHRAEGILPYGKEDISKGRQVERMFDRIAGTYDCLNRMLSLGLDNMWRRKGISMLKSSAPSHILDLATGTGDMAVMMCRMLSPERITAVDISERMMEKGREKVARAGLSDIISFEHRDCMDLSFEDSSFDAVTVAFGLRNFEDTEKGVSEMYRVLKPGGRLLIIELSYPSAFLVRLLYNIYSKTAIPIVGRMMSKEARAYSYLPESIKAVTQGLEMQRALARQGFVDTRLYALTLGVCSIYMGTKDFNGKKDY
jgi:demethylmenaquinone methyltransferase/2-methoxy-6-polyprenyl-1,4-benzoquinol methylase